MWNGRDAKQSHMITAKSPLPASDGTTSLPVPRRWQALWREAVTDPAELLCLLGLEDRAAELLPQRDTGFAVRVPRRLRNCLKAQDLLPIRLVMPPPRRLMESSTNTKVELF